MKRLLFLLTFSLLFLSNSFSQSTGILNYEFCYCPVDPVNCNETQNVSTIIMPYDGKIIFEGSVSLAVSEGADPTSAEFYFDASIDDTDYQGNPINQGIGGTSSGGTTTFFMETNAVLAGTTVKVGTNMNAVICSSGTYNLLYSVIPLTYANDVEPNDDYTQAIPTIESNLVVQNLYEGHGSFTPDDLTEQQEGNDWYKLTAPRDGILTVNVNSDTSYDNFYDTSLSVYSSSTDEVVAGEIGNGITGDGSNGTITVVSNCIKAGDIIYLNFTGNDNSYRFWWSMTTPTEFLDVEPNNVYNDAIVINNGETKNGSLGYGVSTFPNDVSTEDLDDWYKFTTTTSGDVQIGLNSSEPIDLANYVSLYREDSSGNLIETYTLTGDQASGYTATCLSVGTYYINLKTTPNALSGVESYGACTECCLTYDLTVDYLNSASFTEDSEPNNDLTESLYVEANNTHEGQLGYYYVDNNDVFDVDVFDYYELQTDYNGDLSISFTQPIPTGASASLYYLDSGSPNSIGTINTNTNNEIISISYDCAAAGESYYLEINSNNISCFSYQFYYTNTFFDTNTEQEPNDDTTDAQLLNQFDTMFGEVGYGNPSYPDSYDVYELQISESSPLTYNFDLNGDIYVELLENSTTVASVIQDQTTGNINSISYNNIDASQNYNLRISPSSNCTSYYLNGWQQSFSSTNDSEPNNSQGEAIPLNFDQEYQGQLSFYASGNDSQDYYSFTLGTNDDVQFILNAYEGLVSTATLTLYDSVGTQVYQLTHDGTNTSRTSNIINLEADDYYFIISGTDQTGSYTTEVIPQNSGGNEMDVSITAKVFLQGPYDSGSLSDDLRVAMLIPTTSPYVDALICNPAVFTTTGSDAIVDWIWLEIRDTDGTTVLGSTSALIQSDGDVVGTDGISPVVVDAPDGNYLVMLSHRNHLGVLTANPYALTEGNITIVDLRTDSALVMGGVNGVADMGDGNFALFSGDFNGDGQVQNSDKSGVRLELSTSGPSDADLNMNGQIQNTDIQLKLNPNLSRGEQFSSRALNLKLHAKRRDNN